MASHNTAAGMDNVSCNTSIASPNSVLRHASGWDHSRRGTPTSTHSLPGTKILLNVSGKKFTIYRSYLERYPQTLLGSKDLEAYYDPIYGDYFFDTNSDAFESIFDFYLYGRLYQPANIPTEMFQESVHYYRMMSVFEEEEKEEEINTVLLQVKAKTILGRMRQKTNAFLLNPNSSLMGQVYGWIDICFIFLSIVQMMFETDSNIVPILEDKESSLSKVCFTLESITVIYFTFDVLLRFIVTYNKFEFARHPATWLDVLTVAPYYLELFVDVSKFKSLKVLRIARIARVLKLIKKNKRLLLIATVLAASVSELSMLVIVWSMCVLVAGSSFYYIEINDNDTVESGVDGLWWAVVTMSTVGYGDVTPKTTLGKLFGTVFVYVSMVFLALPLTIIVGAFSKQYEAGKCLAVKKNKSVYKPVLLKRE